MAMIDDHEVTNDFAGGASPDSDPLFNPSADYINETELYQNGLHVFHEYNPIREMFYGDTGDPRTANKLKLYRYRNFGSDAAIFLIDVQLIPRRGTEQYFESLRQSRNTSIR